MRDKTGAKTYVSKHGGAPCADVLVDDGDAVPVGGRTLAVRATPGHTAGCVTYVTDDERAAFTGDALFIRGCGRTDFQGGDAGQLWRSVHEKIFTLPDDTVVFPGHDYQGRTASTVGEEKRFNPRLNVAIDEPAFRRIMGELRLDPPKLIDVAVPANQRCGQPPA